MLDKNIYILLSWYLQPVIKEKTKQNTKISVLSVQLF